MSGETVYLTIANDIKQRIVQGTLNPGDILPSENDLKIQYSASRETVRKGLKTLMDDGFVNSFPGKGYFVAKPEYGRFMLDFVEESKGTEIKRVKMIEPDEEVRHALGIAKGKMVIEMGRVVLADEKPVAYDLKYLPYDKGQPVIEGEIDYYANARLPEIAAAVTAPFAFFTNIEISSMPASTELADILECDPGDALLVSKRFLIDRDNRPIGFGIKYMTNDYGPLKGSSGNAWGE